MNRKSLILKNVSNHELVSDYFKYIGAINYTHYGRHRAIVEFSTEKDATESLHKAHQRELGGAIISAEYVGNRKIENKTDCEILKTSSPHSTTKMTEFVKLLCATSSKNGFDQPPNPSIKYSYPSVNQRVVDNISIALFQNKKFYTQVLHLMNRMNLTPPFGNEKDEINNKNVSYHQYHSTCEAETQTDTFDNFGHLNNVEDHSRKQTVLDREQLKIKAKKIIKSKLKFQKFDKIRKSTTLSNDLIKFFESNKPISDSKIEISVRKFTLPKGSTTTIDALPISTQLPTPNTVITLSDLTANRIPEVQLKILPVYKNYERGEKSNKLYIKNLVKEVTEEDLQQIYNCFVKNDNDETFQIKLMQHGKMKGQAFVTFNVKDEDLHLVEKALDTTNGYILYRKPMVVCFGKH